MIHRSKHLQSLFSQNQFLLIENIMLFKILSSILTTIWKENKSGFSQKTVSLPTQHILINLINGKSKTLH